MQPLLQSPLAFAHQTGRAMTSESTLERFQTALKLGATGLVTAAWVTSDGVVVLSDEGVIRSKLRRRPISTMTGAALGDHVLSLETLYAACGTGAHLWLEVGDPAAVPSAVALARAAGQGAEARLWLGHGDWQRVREWRALSDEVRLVHSTRLHAMRQGPERQAAQLAAADIDCICLHERDWTGGLTTLFHRFERYAFGREAHHERILTNLLTMGIDGVTSDYVERMVAAVSQR